MQWKILNITLKLTHEEMGNVNNPILNNEIKFVFKHLPTKKTLGSDDFTSKIYEHRKKK